MRSHFGVRPKAATARRLYEEGLGVKGSFGLAVVVVKDRDKSRFEQRSSLYRLLDGRTRRHGSGLRVRNSKRAVYAARRRAAPPGASALKGSELVSMCQIARVRRRAISTWATLAPRCLPARCLVRW